MANSEDADVENHLRNDAHSQFKYDLVKQIGGGAYGVVYEAKQRDCSSITQEYLSDNGTVALKEVPILRDFSGLSIDALREITNLKSLHHPSIISLLEVQVTTNHVWLALELCDFDLRKECNHYAPNPLPDTKIQRYIQEIIAGVEYCHRHQVVHRDLKPENILLKKGRVKITDFGLARLQWSHNEGGMTPEVQTLWYRAPEVLFGDDCYLHPIDCWSVGCIFMEMLLGSPLMPGEDELSQLNLVIKNFGAPCDSTWPGVEALPNYHIRFKDNKEGIFDEKIYDLKDVTKSLLKGLLTMNPQRRLTARAAKQHEYFEQV